MHHHQYQFSRSGFPGHAGIHPYVCLRQLSLEEASSSGGALRNLFHVRQFCFAASSSWVRSGVDKFGAESDRVRTYNLDQVDIGLAEMTSRSFEVLTSTAISSTTVPSASSFSSLSSTPVKHSFSL